MFILVVELNLTKCRLPKGPIFFLSFESSNARKISLEAGGRGGNQDTGDPGREKVRGERIFFPSSRGEELTLDDTMVKLLVSNLG